MVVRQNGNDMMEEDEAAAREIGLEVAQAAVEEPSSTAAHCYTPANAFVLLSFLPLYRVAVGALQFQESPTCWTHVQKDTPVALRTFERKSSYDLEPI